MENIFDALAQTNIFKGHSADSIRTLLGDKPYRIRQFIKDEYVAYSQHICNDMLIIVEGVVRGEMSDFSGKRLKIEDIAAPRPLAAAFIFGRENRFPVDIIANEPVKIMIIPRDVLIFLLQHSQIILNNYLNVISSRTQFLSNKIRFLSFKTIREKIANFVLNTLPQNSDKLMLNQTQHELADFFGVTRPSLARTLAEMQDEGLISVERKEITILNREKLNKLLNN